jgi:hypothetical protein
VKVSVTIETRKLETGDTEVLLERSTGGYKDSKLHRELFVMTDSPETRSLVRHLERISHGG